MSTTTNRLKSEKSAYLKQHENNPVHWYEYGPEALQKAKDENKPIFLSIGYSSCHWCHVMAHESFEDQVTADYLNENFINIKVDREEYPDIDQYYQKACLFFGRPGGWPLSAFLLPDSSPFFIGTYFPKVGREGMPSFMELLNEITRSYKEDYAELEERGKQITQGMIDGPEPEEKFEFENFFLPPMAVLNALKEYEDKEFGGYGQAPKFPTFAFYEWAIEQVLEGMIEQEGANHILTTLNHMLMGGVFDQVKGGVHRYSTDEKWLVPHFEKMLYDQAGLLRMMAKYSHIMPSPVVFDGLIQTLDYLKTEMLSDQKYFFAAQDADSEGGEGLYFTFTEEEFEEAMKDDSGDCEDLSKHLDNLKKWYGIKKEGNFEQGLNVLSLDPKHTEEMFQAEAWEVIRQAKVNLLEQRKQRIPPATDNKGIASWNFMLASALTDVIQYCPVDVIKRMGLDLLNIVLEGVHATFMINGEGTQNAIKHSTTKDLSLPYAEDYVFFSELQLRVYELTGNEVFKNNFYDSLNFLFKEFVKDGKLYTRALQTNDNADYPNIVIDGVDQSFRSAFSTLVMIARKALLMSDDFDWSEELDKMIEDLKQQSLRSPLASGQALRALSYPPFAYRILKVPRKWCQNAEFNQFMTYLLSRFAYEYHDNDDESWELCSNTECQFSDKGMESLLKTLTPSQEG